jgi:diaminohydroxyphosphoribosylaminopyrimidine deaminase/5-amino-6-(5-phosphoribosylamino)uracil reductase
MLLRSSTVIGPDGIDALDGQPLTALTRSPHLRSRAVETVGPDSIESFERN